MAKVREAKKAENLHHDLEKIKGELSWALVEEKRKVGGAHQRVSENADFHCRSWKRKAGRAKRWKLKFGS